MGDGFSVMPAALRAGSQNVANLHSKCSAISRDTVTALSAMVGSAGNAALEDALRMATGRGNRAYTSMWAAYGHASKSLAYSAQNYSSADEGIANHVKTMVPGFFRDWPQP